MSNKYLRNTFRPKICTTTAPQRYSNPRSLWRDIMSRMKPGHWFELPVKMQMAVANAACLYTRGRYSLYRHPKKAGVYIYLRIK